MRFLFMFLVLTSVIACGKKSGGSSEEISEAQQCEVNGEVVSCDSIYDGLGVDVLNAKVDAPATIDSSSITFTQALSYKAQGRRIECSVSVLSGTVYRYTVSGNTLYLDTPEGNVTMNRVHGSGIMGMWRSTRYVDGATFEELLMSVKKNSVVMQKNCER
jgi:hypothetical protein